MVGNFFGGVTKQSTGDFDSVFLLVLFSSLATLLLSLFMGKERETDTAKSRSNDQEIIAL
jgi:hypothetical protein